MDALLLQELKSLKEELLVAHQGPSALPGQTPANSVAAAPTRQEDSAQEPLHGDLRDFIDEFEKFVEDAEKDVLAHSSASVIGAMIIGILIGRFLGRH